MAQLIFAEETLTNDVKAIGGEVVMDGTAPTSISFVGALRKIVAVLLTIKKTTAPGVLDSVVTYNIETATPLQVDIYPWKVTATNDTTLVTSTVNTIYVSYAVFGY